MHEGKNKKLRGSYQKGGKDFLREIEVGDFREHDPKLNWRSLQCIAAVMSKEFGCKYAFRNESGLKVIYRIK